MSFSAFRLFGFSALMILGACRTNTPDPPKDRDGRGTSLGELCATLRRLGCPEGDPGFKGETCYEHLSRASQVVDVSPECLTADSVGAVRACGSSSTLRFRCATDAGP